MSSFTTYNVSFGCPKCGSINNMKCYSNEGALMELNCDECGEIQSLGVTEKGVEDKEYLGYLADWVKELMEESVRNTPTPTGDIPFDYLAEALNKLDERGKAAYMQLNPGTVSNAIRSARDIWHKRIAVGRVKEFFKDLFNGKVKTESAFGIDQYRVLSILLKEPYPLAKIPPHLSNTVESMKHLVRTRLGEDNIVKKAETKEDLAEEFAEFLVKLGFVRE